MPVRANQRELAAELRSSYDFIVCGSGSSGSVVAGRLAESGRASVLLLEVGNTDDVPSVREPAQWLADLGTERDWQFQAVPNAPLSGRRLPLNAGKGAFEVDNGRSAWRRDLMPHFCHDDARV